MSIQPFCNDCPHKNIDKNLKEIYNSYVKPFFHHCPETNENVIDCFGKRTEIDWKHFTEWCVKNELVKVVNE